MLGDVKRIVGSRRPALYAERNSGQRKGGMRQPQATEANRVVEIDQAALRRVYEEHVTLIYRYIYARVGNREDAEDLTSQVFVKALHSLEHDRDPMSIRAWLVATARTTVADHWREQYKLGVVPIEPLVDWLHDDEPVEQAETATARARAILDALPENYRRVLTLRFLRGYSVKETARELGLTESNVKVLQFRALQKSALIGQRLGYAP